MVGAKGLPSMVGLKLGEQNSADISGAQIKDVGYENINVGETYGTLSKDESDERSDEKGEKKE
jgi:hypothetical protein